MARNYPTALVVLKNVTYQCVGQNNQPINANNTNILARLAVSENKYTVMYILNEQGQIITRGGLLGHNGPRILKYMLDRLPENEDIDFAITFGNKGVAVGNFKISNGVLMMSLPGAPGMVNNIMIPLSTQNMISLKTMIDEAIYIYDSLPPYFYEGNNQPTPQPQQNPQPSPFTPQQPVQQPTTTPQPTQQPISNNSQPQQPANPNTITSNTPNPFAPQNPQQGNRQVF